MYASKSRKKAISWLKNFSAGRDINTLGHCYYWNSQELRYGFRVETTFKPENLLFVLSIKAFLLFSLFLVCMHSFVCIYVCIKLPPRWLCERENMWFLAQDYLCGGWKENAEHKERYCHLIGIRIADWKSDLFSKKTVNSEQTYPFHNIKPM